MLRIHLESKLKYINLKKFRLFCTINNFGSENVTSNSALEGGYCPGEFEKNVYVDGYFDPELKDQKPFSLILPPPNITGNLHLGHALTATIEDVIVRWKRMQGIETLWIPGIDHAGIATQVIVEKRLWKDSRQTRHDIGRENFQEEVWKWKHEKAKIIAQQLRRLGCSLNWSREVFTMDPSQCFAVTQAFIKLFEMGLIYRADHLVNWSCVLQSAISDIEVDHHEVKGPTRILVPGYEKSVEFGVLTKFAYKLVNSNDEVVVATTRPETMLGDVAVAVHPKDDRYSRYIGCELWHPFRKQTIPVISDEFVDPNFGTGAVKVTPAHDPTDFQVGKRHNLNIIQIIDEKGNLTDACGEYSGTRRFDARDILVSQLEKLQLLRGRQDHSMIVPICSRSKDIVEYLLKPQWFIKCTEMAKKASQDVTEGRITIEPKHFEKIWFNYLDNIRDWCISRQLWWGHRIPAYRCHPENHVEQGLWVAAESSDVARYKAAAKLSTSGKNLVVQQDEDVLDTWFSSALLPFSSLGWPQQSKDLTQYYPLDIMETGHDILFFWVARMAMLGTQLTGQLPFKKILLHGIICDAQGRKMSKSLGNVVAPEDIIGGSTLEQLEATSKANFDAGILSMEELNRAIQGQKTMFPNGIPECGADALRFTLCSHNFKNHFINFDVQECHVNKLFCNKIWQATKFVNMSVERIPLEKFDVGPWHWSLMDNWILSRLAHLIDIAHENMENYNFHNVTNALKNFIYYEFCDTYLETTKRGLKDVDNESAAGHSWTLIHCLETSLRILAPFMPRLAQHLHENLVLIPGMQKSFHFPEKEELRDKELEKDVETVMEVVKAIRRLKKYFQISAKHNSKVYIVSDLPLWYDFKTTIEDLTACHQVNITSHVDKALIKQTVSDCIGNKTRVYLTVPKELKENLMVDLPKLETKKTKLIKELDKMNKMITGENYKLKVTLEAQESHAKKIQTLEDKLARISYIQKICE